VITEAALSEDSVAAQIHALSMAAYTLEADRIGCVNFPPLRETIEELRQSSDRFLAFQRAGRIVGALSFDRIADFVAITRLVVSPAYLRQGIATALLTSLEERLPSGARLCVSTARANTAAVLLYQRLGYAIVRVSISAEGIPLTQLAKSK
jgi:ribosomal protein S18 acetylase RimI-like enzyme